MRNSLIALLLFFTVSTAYSQTCAENAESKDAALPEATRAEYLKNVEAAARKYAADKTADNLIWVGRRVGYLGQYAAAIEVFTEGIEKFPNDARFYRHRGHRQITLRCFDDAIADLEKAAALIKGKPDEVEPDDMPNAKNIPTSTLQSNIWYHLGLAHYLQGSFAKAHEAYARCLQVSNNDDSVAATGDWLWIMTPLFRHAHLAPPGVCSPTKRYSTRRR